MKMEKDFYFLSADFFFFRTLRNCESKQIPSKVMKQVSLLLGTAGFLRCVLLYIRELLSKALHKMHDGFF